MILLPIHIHLKLSIASLGITLHLMRIAGFLVANGYLLQVLVGGGVGEQLALAGVFHACEEEGCFVDGVADGEEAVVAEDGGFLYTWRKRGD